jgi:hypothetical protein
LDSRKTEKYQEITTHYTHRYNTADFKRDSSSASKGDCFESYFKSSKALIS